ncbi:unnamed protein product [Phytophthora lilii]|uniref:Unnamed protein product n=1 Tax=Phytophthora lilii TaxID=2077276 RepID=A0A9W7CNM8_9STRA|nr:unnamed protein product [Phytophthora lilii]
MTTLASWLSTLLVTILAVAHLTTPSSTEFSGNIKLYRDIRHRHILVMLEFTKANRCFNMACGDYNDAVSSVKWSGLPTSGAKSVVAFYVDTDCKGRSKKFSTSLGTVASFDDEEINDAISSFMVLESSEEIENGVTSLCSLETTTFDNSSYTIARNR